MKREPAEHTPCPVCACRFSSVIDSHGTKRIRQCVNCGAEYDTEETVTAIRDRIRPRLVRPPRLPALL